MLYWILGILLIVIAFIVIRLFVADNNNEDSKLGILEHPSFYKKQDIEMFDDSSSKDSDDKQVLQ